MSTHVVNLSKPLKFNDRWLFCVEYLELRDAMRKKTIIIFDKNATGDIWNLRVLLILFSSLVICGGAYHSGIRGFIHGVAFIASLWWLFYFLGCEILLSPRLTRKWLAFLMAFVRLSRDELDLLKASLPKATFAFKNRSKLFILTGAGMFFLASRDVEPLIVILYVVCGFCYIELTTRVLRPILNSYRCGKITAISAKRLLSLYAWQELGGLMGAAISLIVIKTIYLMISSDHEIEVLMNFRRCYSYFFLAANIYFFSQAVPVLISLVAPALTLETKSSGIFYIITTIGLVILGNVGFTVIQVFVVAFAAMVFWNMFVFYSQRMLKVRLCPIIKALLMLILSLGVATTGSFSLELAFIKLGVATNVGVSFCILLTCVVWVDYVVFGVISSFYL